MPASVVAGEGMKLVDHDGPDRSEELPVIDPRGDQDDFERLGRGQEAVGRIGDDAPLLGLGRVAVPAGGPPTHQAEVALQPLLLVVQQGPDRADVEDARARPRIRSASGRSRGRTPPRSSRPPSAPGR